MKVKVQYSTDGETYIYYLRAKKGPMTVLYGARWNRKTAQKAIDMIQKYLPDIKRSSIRFELPETIIPRRKACGIQ